MDQATTARLELIDKELAMEGLDPAKEVGLWRERNQLTKAAAGAGGSVDQGSVDHGQKTSVELIREGLAARKGR